MLAESDTLELPVEERESQAVIDSNITQQTVPKNETAENENPIGSSSRLSLWVPILCWLALVGLLVISATRVYTKLQTPGPFNPASQGFCDFHNGVYYPALAFLHGDSPYSTEFVENYPVERTIPFYSPVILAGHVPLALLPLHVAETAYFGWMALLVAALGILIAKWHNAVNSRQTWWRNPTAWTLAALIGIAIVVSRGGQQTVFTGYFTFELILASVIAVHHAHKRPWLAGLALLVVSAKPTYVIPLGFLMLARGNFRALSIGAALSIVGALLGFLWIAPEAGLQGLVDEIGAAQEFHRADEYELPVNTWIRLDLLAIYAKWTNWQPDDLTHLWTMAVILVPVCALLANYHRRVEDDGSVLGLSGAVVLVVPLLAMYHHVYDAVVAAPIIVAALLCQHPFWRRLSLAWRWLIAACCLFPGINYLSSQIVLSRLGVQGTTYQLITSVNCVALSIACALLLTQMLWATSRSLRSVPEESTS